MRLCKKAFAFLQKIEYNKPFAIEDGLSPCWEERLNYLSPDKGDNQATIGPSYSEGKYKFVGSDDKENKNKGYLTCVNHYKIDVDKPIREIDFDSKKEEKSYTKKKTR